LVEQTIIHGKIAKVLINGGRLRIPEVCGFAVISWEKIRPLERAILPLVGDNTNPVPETEPTGARLFSPVPEVDRVPVNPELAPGLTTLIAVTPPVESTDRT
jgi:hypothetical protein